MEHQHRHAAPARGARREEPAGWCNYQLLPESGGTGPGDPGNPRRQGPAGAPLLQRRQTGQGQREYADGSQLLDPPAANPVCAARFTPLHLGPAIAAGNDGKRSGVSDGGDLSRHAERPGANGARGTVHSQTDRRRTEPCADVNRTKGPTAEGASGMTTFLTTLKIPLSLLILLACAGFGVSA